MNREIKFRAWDENNGFMFYQDGDLAVLYYDLITNENNIIK